MDVLCIGSAVLDITASPVDRNDSWDEKQRISEIQITVGGDAANQCIRMADDGVDVGILSAVGMDQNGSVIRNELVSRGVCTEYLLQKDSFPTGTALILLDRTGGRTIFSVRGAYCELSADDLNGCAASDLKAVSVAGLFTEPNLEADGSLLSFLREAGGNGILTFADLASDKRHQGLAGIRPFLPHLDYFLPSLFDAAKMTRTEDPAENAAVFRRLGCRNVIIKCGAEGCYIASEDFQGWVRAHGVNPVDTTGAGDCMVALFISRILKGDGIQDACRYACDGATYSTLFHGASTHRILPSQLQEWKEKEGLA